MKAERRFHTVQSGIETWHTYSAGAHYDPDHLSYGPVVGLDEHLVEPGAGFAWHAHRGVHIATWILEGTLRHEDSNGSLRLVVPGELLVQCTGDGIRHRETNASDIEPLRFVQVTILGDGPVGVRSTAPPASVANVVLDVELGELVVSLAPTVDGMERIELGGLTTSAQGLGCMGMSQSYGQGDWDESISVIHRAIELGVTMIDTANVYGTGHNEVLVGRALHDRRDQVELATKFGIDNTMGWDNRTIHGTAGYVQQACEDSLTRLGVEHIDLYYLHRPPQDAEIEETVGAMAALVEQGKVRFLGLSEVDDGLLRRAHAVHPIAAVQSEYSLWTRDPETTVLAALRELGVGLVPFSPLGRGFLTGTLDPSTFGEKDFRARNPRFVGEAAAANQQIADAVAEVARRHDVAPAQIALAWVSQRAGTLGVPVVPIPGTKRTKWLEQNVAALDVELTADDLSELDGLADKVVGARY